MEHVYLVCYDIRNPKRWRKVYRTMKGFGEWLQLSVFHCRLTREKHLRMQDQLGEMINRSEDHLLIIDMGPAESVELRVESIGKPFEPIEKDPVIVSGVRLGFCTGYDLILLFEILRISMG